MSNTSRWVQPGWDSATLAKPPRSKKHQMRDRDSQHSDHRFAKGQRNSLHNLRSKVEDMRLDEQFEELEDRYG